MFNFVYLDTDLTIKHYPHLFDVTGYDIMLRNWNIDNRGYEDNYIYENIIETSGGILCFSNSNRSIRILDLWYRSLMEYKNKADDRVLSNLLIKHDYNMSLSIFQLPIEFLWLNEDYDYNINIQKLNIVSIIEHPECISSEDEVLIRDDSLEEYTNIRIPKTYLYNIKKKCIDISDNIKDKYFSLNILLNLNLYEDVEKYNLSNFILFIIKKYKLNYFDDEDIKKSNYIYNVNLNALSNFTLTNPFHKNYDIYIFTYEEENINKLVNKFKTQKILYKLINKNNKNYIIPLIYYIIETLQKPIIILHKNFIINKILNNKLEFDDYLIMSDIIIGSNNNKMNYENINYDKDIDYTIFLPTINNNISDHYRRILLMSKNIKKFYKIFNNFFLIKSALSFCILKNDIFL